MSDPLYRREILRLAADAHGAGRIVEPNATGSAFNPSCGDRVVFDLLLDEGAVTDLAHETRACVLAQASASILGKALAGCTRPDLEALRAAVAAMLEGGSGNPGAPFAAYEAFEGFADHPARHRCVMLPIDAALAAFENAENSGAGKP